ncbi:protein FAR-RED IMPAIRED RESPONSE 1-like [Ziziphus jujuba]|uniref:Protein FAR-RED IMPAIRED RESPONSE 1-like n=1 Tax=Ziziphus jujuba TaxID=326968 RepID=A0ABM3ZXJ3_ZIZJJ|nr:protein FAR-RED IMPAIRED RESPONSE 1-like [Ziziphus jujuba]
MDLEIDLNLNLDECNKEGDEREIDNIKDGEDGKILELYDGMEFDSYQKAYSCYLKYTKLTGFGITTRSSRRSKTYGEFTDVKFVCTRYELKQESNAANQHPYLKIDCKSMLHVKKKLGGKWYVHSFIKTHNHELYPAHGHYFPCHRRITSSNKNSINNLHAVGVSTSKIFAAIAKQHGGYEIVGFLEKDIRNNLDKERHLALEMGHAKAMLEHFVHLKKKILTSFMQLTWMKNKVSKMFFGLMQKSILFGYALLKDETTSTFIWLMKTWIRAMGGKPPSAILTDQDKAMKAAIAIVFPNTRHRFCLWHILRKVPEKLAHVIKANESFMRSFNNCIYNSWTNEDFKNKWWNMIKNCKLKGNEWLESLFEDQKHWVPVYMRDTFFAEPFAEYGGFNPWFKTNTIMTLQKNNVWRKAYGLQHVNELHPL